MEVEESTVTLASKAAAAQTAAKKQFLRNSSS